MKIKGKAFVSGPYSAPTPEGVAANVAAAVLVAQELTKLGWVVVCPNFQLNPLAELQDYDFWLEAALLLLGDCDIMVMVPGWEVSSGVKRERARALVLRIPMFETTQEVEDLR
jgi:hypothetical protein